jgi:hypothetical protein
MPTLTQLLADLVVLIHLAFVLFVVFGGLLILRRRRIAWLHVPAFVWAAAIEFGGWICPLTPLENRLREMSGEAGYAGGFVERYLVPILYPEELTREIQIALGIAVLLINLAIYGFLLRRRKACTEGKEQGADCT